MASSRRTILIRGNMQGFEEALAGATVYPGYFLGPKASDGTVSAHAVRGGKGLRTFCDLTPQSLIGNLITQSITATNPVGILHAAPGNVVNALLKAGETAVIGSPLISAGDGSLIVLANTVLGNIVADSATLTSWTTAVAFSNGTVSIPANTLKVGDRIRIRCRVAIPSTNSTDTMTFTVNIGSTALISSGALNVTNDDVFYAEFILTVRTIGSGGTIVGSGQFVFGPLATAIYVAQVLNSTTLDTTAAASITVKAACSVSNSGNQAILRELTVEKITSGESSALAGPGNEIIGFAEEAVDNSLGTDPAFCETRVAA